MIEEGRTTSRKSFRPWLKVLTGSVLLLILLVALAIPGGIFWLKHAMRDSLPLLDGQERLVGLRAAVTVQRDSHGVPHIRANNMEDLLMAQGYVTAQDRLWQMDMARRSSAGELSELLGSRDG